MSTSLPHEVRTVSEPRQRGLHSVFLSQITQVNPTIRLLRLSLSLPSNHPTSNAESLSQSVHFSPGQWLDVHVPSIAQAGGFTITSTPSDALQSPEKRGNGGYLELAVQRSPKNPPAAWLWRPEDEILGAELKVRVGGSFVWPPPGIEESKIRRAVFVAGGVGINPLMSMISHIHQTTSFPDQVQFLYSTRGPCLGCPLDEILFVSRLRSIASATDAMRLTLFLTGEEDGDTDDPAQSIIQGSANVLKRRITKEDLLTAVGGADDPEGTVCYICGPSGMTDEFVDLVKDMPGMDEKRVFYEKWW